MARASAKTRALVDRLRKRGLSVTWARDPAGALARLAELEARPGGPAPDDPFTGRSRAIARVRDQVRHLATTHTAVLIEGEAGTGKSLAARAIHEQSPRRGGPFVAFDLGACDAQAIEPELFGAEDASAGQRSGRLEQADGGTLFLDQIALAPSGVQIRLLRLLQDRVFERTGGQTTVRVDVRVITATDRDLERVAKDGRFREDLLRRLGVVRIVMPPLRDRREDIPLLADRFLRELHRAHRHRSPGITRGVLERLQRHRWPGNVRELRDTIESMAVAAPGRRPLALADLPPTLRRRTAEREPIEIAPGMTVDEAERLLISATLAHVGGDKPRAAAMLGIGLRTLYRKIEGYGIG